MPCGWWEDEYRTSIPSRAPHAALPWCEWWHRLLSVVNPRGEHSDKISTCLDPNSSVQEKKTRIFSFFKSTNLILCPLLPELVKCSIWGHLVSGSHVGTKTLGKLVHFPQLLSPRYLFAPDLQFPLHFVFSMLLSYSWDIQINGPIDNSYRFLKGYF